MKILSEKKPRIRNVIGKNLSHVIGTSTYIMAGVDYENNSAYNSMIRFVFVLDKPHKLR